MKLIKIPTSFKLFGTTINVVWDNQRCNNEDAYGQFDNTRNEIMLCDKSGIKELSKDKIIDTYYHEKVHAILNSMYEFEISKREQFVEIFSKLLRQSDDTTKYSDNDKG
jgi:hypothetical protein